MLKRIISGILTACMMLSSASALAANDIVFFNNDTKAYFNNEFVDILDGEGITPTIRNGIFYVPIRPFVELNNGSIVWKHNDEKVQADFALGSYYTIQQDSNVIVEFDGESSDLSAEVFLNSNYERLMVPADTFEKLGYKILQTEDYLGIFSVSETEDVIGVDFSSDNSAITDAVIKYSMLNDEGYAYANNISATGDIIGSAAGGLDIALDVTAIGGSVNKAEIAFTYDETKLNGVAEEDLKIVWYNELLGRVELLENSVVDTDNNIVSVSTSHFSKYSVVNSKEWYEAWAHTQLIKRDYGYGNGLFNVYLVLDTSGSMRDSMGLLKETVIQFIDRLNENDILNIIAFSDGAYTLIEKVQKKDVDYADIVNRMRSGGGTDMLSGLQKIPWFLFGSSDLQPHSPIPTPDAETQMNDLMSDATTVVILLSDGEPDSDNSRDELIKKCSDIGFGKRFVSVALGSNANMDFMKQLAGTNGLYRYIDNSSGLADMFMQISGEVIGLEEDTDGDGIPDLIETTGMRDQAGNIFTTDPYNADTDGDLMSDGDEMGEFESENGGYFIRQSDPTIYTQIDSSSKISASNVSPRLIDLNNSINLDVYISLVEREIVEQNSISGTGETDHSITERIFSNVQDGKIEVANCSDCLSIINGGSWDLEQSNDQYIHKNQYLQVKCNNGISKCTNDHSITFSISGSNLEPYTFTANIDTNVLIREKTAEQLAYIQDKIDSHVKNKVTAKAQDWDSIQNIEESSLVSNIEIIWTDKIPSKDFETAAKLAVINLIGSQNALEKISASGVQMVKDSYNLINIVNDETVEVPVNNTTYKIKFNGFSPTISWWDKVLNISFLDGECYTTDDPGTTYSFTYAKMDEEGINEFLQAYNALLDELNEDAQHEATKKAIQDLLKSWDITSVANKMTEEMLKECGIYEAMNLFQKTVGIYDMFVKDGGMSTDEIAYELEEYDKDYLNANIGDSMIDAAIEELMRWFE